MDFQIFLIHLRIHHKIIEFLFSIFFFTNSRLQFFTLSQKTLIKMPRTKNVHKLNRPAIQLLLAEETRKLNELWQDKELVDKALGYKTCRYDSDDEEPITSRKDSIPYLRAKLRARRNRCTVVEGLINQRRDLLCRKMEAQKYPKEPEDPGDYLTNMRKKHGDNFYYSEKYDTVHFRTNDGVWHANGIFKPTDCSTQHPSTLE